MTTAGWLVPLIALPFFYVLPGDRVISILEQQRGQLGPIRVEAELAGLGESWPGSIVLELHPERGARVQDDAGGRWLVHEGRVVAGSSDPAPAWIPELEVLSLKTEEGIRDWLARARVDLAANQLGRLGEQDCFVLGGRDGSSQLWVDKDRFEVLRWVSGFGREVRYSSWTDWERLRFPSILELHDRNGPFATLAIHSVSAAPHLETVDFSPAWAHER